MSTKTVAEKLLIKPQSTLWLLPSEQRDLIEPLPEGVQIVDELGAATTALMFAANAASVREMLSTYQDQLTQPSIFWVAYPKGNRTDINRDSLWPILSEYGLRPITQVAVDNVWSALRFRPLKPGEAPFAGGR